VHAFLCRVEVDEAVDPGRDELLVRPAAQPDGLVHAGDAGSREADPHLGRRGLEVVGEQARVCRRHGPNASGGAPEVCAQPPRKGADIPTIVIPALIVGGFLLGLGLGRWWALVGSAAVGISFGIWSEVEIPGWYYGFASAAVAGASIGAGVLLRRLAGR